MALTISGTTLTATPRIAPVTDGDTVSHEGLGGVDLDARVGLQTGTAFQDLNNFIAAWADAQNCSARAAMVDIRLRLDAMLTQLTRDPGVYEP